MISQRLLLAIFSACTTVALTGCGGALNESSVATSLPKSKGVISGSLRGGQQPVSNSSVYLFAAATSGYGQVSTSLLSGANVLVDSNSRGYVLTAADGTFNITGDYQCPTSTSLVYLVAMGGNPGLAAGTNNKAIAIVAALGNCVTLKANAATTFVQMNEVTTVAAAYSLAGFMTASDHVGASSTNFTGISNAFNTAALLASTVTGTSSIATPAGNGAIPQAELYTLADALASCVNSNGSSPCTALFQATTVNGVAPTDTLQAVLSLAHNPGISPTPIMNLVGSAPPFQPALVATPNDWTVAITYTGNGIATPQSIAIDASGNAWIANTTNTITELSAGSGAPLSGATGFGANGLDAPVSLAIGTTGSLWIANCGDACSGSGNPSTITVLSPNGQSSSSYTSSGLNAAYAIAVSGSNQAWVANSLGSSLTQLNPSGTTAIPTLLAPTLLYPTSVAVSPGGNALTVSPANNALVGFTAAGVPDTTNSYQGSGLNFPYAVALDHNGNAWVANHGNNTVAQLSSGALVGGSAYSGGGITSPNAIALDGAGNVWVTNSGNSISGLTNAGLPLSPTTGLRNDLIYPNAIAVDGSGNLWVANCGHYCLPGSANSGAISLIVGAAVPGVTPISQGAASNTLGALP
jgi:streptogramin lyase